MHTQCKESTFEGIRHRGLARARQPCQPDDSRRLMLQAGTRPAINLIGVGHDVEGTTQGMGDHPCGDRVGAHSVDEEEPTGIAALCVHVHRDRHIRGDLDATDVIHVQDARGELLAGNDVKAMAHNRHRGGHDTRTHSQEIGPAMHERLFAHPDDIGGKPIRGLRPGGFA